MSSMHDNGRVGESSDTDAQADLVDLIDNAGATVAAVLSLAAVASHAAVYVEGWDGAAQRSLLSVASDSREAAFYLRRALDELRALL